MRPFPPSRFEIRLSAWRLPPRGTCGSVTRFSSNPGLPAFYRTKPHSPCDSSNWTPWALLSGNSSTTRIPLMRSRCGLPTTMPFILPRPDSRWLPLSAGWDNAASWSFAKAPNTRHTMPIPAGFPGFGPCNCCCSRSITVEIKPRAIALRASG